MVASDTFNHVINHMVSYDKEFIYLLMSVSEYMKFYNNRFHCTSHLCTLHIKADPRSSQQKRHILTFDVH